MKSEDLRVLYKKKIEEFNSQCLKTTEILPGEQVTCFEESEIKKMTKKMSEFRDSCAGKNISVREFEEESISFITDKYKRFFFNSKWAQRIYNINNSIASTALGYWGFSAVGALGNTNRFMISTELSKSFLPIDYFTGITFRFWAYISDPIPPVAKVFDGISHIVMSPIWCLEYLFNKGTAKIWESSPLRVSIPLYITGEVTAGSGLTWDKLNHTFVFVQKMSENWDISVEL